MRFGRGFRWRARGFSTCSRTNAAWRRWTSGRTCWSTRQWWRRSRRKLRRGTWERAMAIIRGRFGALVDEPVRRLTGLTLGRLLAGNDRGSDEAGFLDRAAGTRVAAGCAPLSGQGGQGRSGGRVLQATHDVRDIHAPGILVAARASRHSRDERTARMVRRAARAGWGGHGFGAGAILSGGDRFGPQSAADRCAAGAGRRRVRRPTTASCCGRRFSPAARSGIRSMPRGGKSAGSMARRFRAFGHPGAGGSHGFGDPETGISFAYTMNQMNLSVMPGVKCVEMVDALFSGA